jgi:hypothetical protein
MKVAHLKIELASATAKLKKKVHFPNIRFVQLKSFFNLESTNFGFGRSSGLDLGLGPGLIPD